MQGIRFDYFHGMEAEQYSFYRIPKMLFTAECFRSLSCEAKVLYGLMLDRMGLSILRRAELLGRELPPLLEGILKEQAAGTGEA